MPHHHGSTPARRTHNAGSIPNNNTCLPVVKTHPPLARASPMHSLAVRSSTPTTTRPHIRPAYLHLPTPPLYPAPSTLQLGVVHGLGWSWGGGGGGGGVGAEGCCFCEMKTLFLVSFRIPAVCLLCLRLCALLHQPKSPCQPRKRHCSKCDRLLLQKITRFLFVAVVCLQLR